MAANDGFDLTYHLNRLAGTLVNGVAQLPAVGAANKWASTNGLALVGCLNTLYASRNSGKNYNYGLQGVLNGLAGTTGLGVNEASARITS